MISEKLGHRLDNLACGIAKSIFGENVHPHLLTLMGFLINLGAGACLGIGHWVAAGWLILLAGFFDVLDGAVARVSNKTTNSVDSWTLSLTGIRTSFFLLG